MLEIASITVALWTKRDAGAEDVENITLVATVRHNKIPVGVVNNASTGVVIKLLYHGEGGSYFTPL